jgi:uncharacterized protein (TIGR00251 family)
MSKKKSKKSKEETIEPDIPPVHNNPKELNSFYAWENDVLILNVLGTPSAKRDAIGKPFGNQLKISVREAPVGGKATDYMVRFLAGEFDISTKDIEVVKGRFNVNKQLRIKNPQNLPPEIEREQTLNCEENSFQKRKKK